MTAPAPRTTLHTALRAQASGIPSTQAGIELLISHQSFLRRKDFIDRFVHQATQGPGVLAICPELSSTAFSADVVADLRFPATSRHR